MIDPKVVAIVAKELQRQNQQIELIASENYVSQDVLRAEASCLTNKYAEGYPARRYYNGCEIVDEGELLAQERVKQLFRCSCDGVNCKVANFHANVQPHSGSQANVAVYLGLLQPGDTIMGMSLDAGGHLTHGHFANFSGIVFNSVQYHVLPSGEINFAEVERLALQKRPKLIICGASSYSLTIDFKKFRIIADKIGAWLLADVAHIAGLIVAGLHPNPVHDADVVTFTTHKTLRGPRGGVILCRKKLALQIDRGVFPICQGGPLEHVILAKAQAFYEASQPAFRCYQQQVVNNAQTMVQALLEKGCTVINQKTVNHLLSIDTRKSFRLSGKATVNRLEKINIIANKNMVPCDPAGATVTSGARIGTAAMTTRGFGQKEFLLLTDLIYEACTCPYEEFKIKINSLQKRVCRLLKPFPVHYHFG